MLREKLLGIHAGASRAAEARLPLLCCFAALPPFHRFLLQGKSTTRKLLKGVGVGTSQDAAKGGKTQEEGGGWAGPPARAAAASVGGVPCAHHSLPMYGAQR